jgi:hypothetical protein
LEDSWKELKQRGFARFGTLNGVQKLGNLAGAF